MAGWQLCGFGKGRQNCTRILLYIIYGHMSSVLTMKSRKGGRSRGLQYPAGVYRQGSYVDLIIRSEMGEIKRTGHCLKFLRNPLFFQIALFKR